MTANVVEKVRKLLKLAESPNVHEAAAAAAQAQRIMDEHRIEEAVLRLSSDRDAARESDEIMEHGDNPLYTSRRFVDWRAELADALANANGCRVFFRRWTAGEHKGKVSIIVVGRESDRQAVQYLYDYLAHAIDRACARKLRKYGKGKRARTWGANFRHGAVAAIASRLKQERIRLWRELQQAHGGFDDKLCRLTDAIVHVQRRRDEVNRWIRENMDVGAEPREDKHAWNPLAYAMGKIQGATIQLSSKRQLEEG